MLSRGTLFMGILLLAVLAAGLTLWPRKGADSPDAAGPVGDLPDAAGFQTGDLIWPKKKGAILPFSVGPQAKSPEQLAWEAERDDFLQSAETSGASQDVIAAIRKLQYGQFEAVYFEEPNPGAPGIQTRGLGGTVSVGHVGIIERDSDGTAYVIEATPVGPWAAIGQGKVIRTPYAEWIKGHDDHQVWHGRVRDATPEARARIADEARRQLGKPYQFFNFNLDDDSGFYCSKLAWMSIWRALGIAADGNADPDRGKVLPPWFSPRQLANAPVIDMVHKPGDY